MENLKIARAPHAGARTREREGEFGYPVPTRVQKVAVDVRHLLDIEPLFIAVCADQDEPARWP